MKYCESVWATKRRPTREVKVGRVGVGGNNPIRLQSMTTSNTRDIEATVEQILRLKEFGCAIVRVTVQGMKEAEACEKIKSRLLQLGEDIPLVADIHFYPPAAMAVVDFVEKVRINPGNFVDKRATFKTVHYDDDTYAAELARIEEKFAPLVEKCKRLNRAMRIGTNHGSLSDRIMNRFGDTPQGMVESALEFARVCRKYGYHDLIFSMKASNPLVMIQAYRLLAKEMYRLEWDYPLHLGVTEAGEGEDGRIKSAMGIGTLLLDGLGDTIRVSLTEDPWHEIDPCRRIVHCVNKYEKLSGIPFTEKFRDVEKIERRKSQVASGLPLHRDGSVGIAIESIEQLHHTLLFEHLGCHVKEGKVRPDVSMCDFVWLRPMQLDDEALHAVEQLQSLGIGIFSNMRISGAIPYFRLQEALQRMQPQKPRLALAEEKPFALVLEEEEPKEWEHLLALKPSLIFFCPQNDPFHKGRHFCDWLREKKCDIPVILSFPYSCSKDDMLIACSMEMGGLFCDGFGDGVCIRGPFGLHALRVLGFNLLQAARRRTSKTEFISCPGCGRTLFNLQQVSEKIRGRTAHLPGVKIAIMGCIVNGPGEMADADFGYVGSRPHMIDLYVGKECVQRNIPFDEAPDRLVQLIKDHGRWIEPAFPK